MREPLQMTPNTHTTFPTIIIHLMIGLWFLISFIPQGMDRARHEANPATLSKLPAVAIPDLETIDNCCAIKNKLSSAHTMVTLMEKPLTLRNGTGIRKNLKSEQTANRRSALTQVHNHLGKVMLSVNQVVVGKTDDTMTKVTSIKPMTLVTIDIDNILSFKFNSS